MTGSISRNKKLHSDFTEQWACAVGFSPREARKIAQANQKTDTTHPYRRGRHLNTNPLIWYGGTSMWQYAQKSLAQAIAFRDLEKLGQGLHSLQDHYTHGWLPIYGRHWFGPWPLALGKRGKRKRFLSPYNPDQNYSHRKLEIIEEASKNYLHHYLAALFLFSP